MRVCIGVTDQERFFRCNSEQERDLEESPGENVSFSLAKMGICAPLIGQYLAAAEHCSD